MTIQLPPDNIFDSVLKVFGKRRGIIVPLNKTTNQFGFDRHAVIKAKKEGFLKALFKRKP